mgnify:CR=1 FL=1
MARHTNTLATNRNNRFLPTYSTNKPIRADATYIWTGLKKLGPNGNKREDCQMNAGTNDDQDLEL